MRVSGSLIFLGNDKSSIEKNRVIIIQNTNPLCSATINSDVITDPLFRLPHLKCNF